MNFVRFQYKSKEAINAKVLKDIKFPIDFDAFELCSQALQAKLTPMREKFKEIEDAALNEPKFKEDGRGEKLDKPKKRTTPQPYSFDDDVGSNNSGNYTLQAVLTHQGRSSSSGHYVGWVRQSTTEDKWVKFDDDVVSPITSEEILRLSGGGDWHCAYVLLYGPRILELPIKDGEPSTATEPMQEWKIWINSQVKRYAVRVCFFDSFQWNKLYKLNNYINKNHKKIELKYFFIFFLFFIICIDWINKIKNNEWKKKLNV